MEKIKQNFYQKSIISVKQFSRQDLKILFTKAKTYQQKTNQGNIFNDLSGKIMTALFYEPSSRTFGSFTSSMQRLGGGIIPIPAISSTSVKKGESFTDTILTFASYSDLIVLRHSEEGIAEKAAKTNKVPIINAGDGTNEHPTQALLDLFTIKEKLKRVDNLKIALVGDLKYGRTVHSLSLLLSLFDKITIFCIAPKACLMPQNITADLKKKKVKVQQLSSIKPIIKQVDVLYMTRVQKERMKPEVYQKIKGAFLLNNKLVKQMKREAIVMHPLPRVGEINEEVDVNPRAVYLKEQMRNGLFVRMALISLILKK